MFLFQFSSTHPFFSFFFWQTDYLSLPPSTVFLLDHEMSSPPIWCFSNPLGEVCGGGTDIMPPYFRATFRWFKVTATASLHSVRLTHKATVESNVNATELSDRRTHEIQFSAQSEEWCDKLQTLSRGGASTIETATSKTLCGCFFCAAAQLSQPYEAVTSAKWQSEKLREFESLQSFCSFSTGDRWRVLVGSMKLFEEFLLKGQLGTVISGKL